MSSRCLSTNQIDYFGKGSIPVAQALIAEGAPRRCALWPSELITQPFEGIDTTYDILLAAERAHGTKNAFGWRDIINVIEEQQDIVKVVDGKKVTETKKWKYFRLSDYKYLSYVEVRQAVSEVARGLYALGIKSKDIFNIYAQTSPNWQLISHACSSISVTVATAYDTLGEAGLARSLSEPECIGVFTNAGLLPTLLRVLPLTPTVKYVIYDGEATSPTLRQISAVRPGLIRTFNILDLRSLGKTKAIEPLEPHRPKPETTACIMYTSGSTGNPKGVVITHRNLIASIGGITRLLEHHLRLDDSYLAYLPLAHILEYIIELLALGAGMPIGYGRVKTLADESVRGCKGDISTFRPSLMAGVPAVWEMIKKNILTKVNDGGLIRRGIFHGAMALKRNGVPVLAQIANGIVFRRVRAGLGGRLRLALSGGASLSRETQEFLSIALVDILQGYGMTESCGTCTILPPELAQFGSVGLPVPSVEIKLRDVPDIGYFSTNLVPQGEICVRGPCVVSGHYKRQDLNEDGTIFMKDGWFRTGDVGQWNADGTLSIIDRVKNLIKLRTGEYIAIQHLESIYGSCNFVENICVHATPDAAQPLAVIFPYEVHLRHFLVNFYPDIDSRRSFGELCEDTEVKELILKECNSLGRKNGLKGPELLLAVILTQDEWTPENGLVTAAQKIQRSKITKLFEKEIKDAYKDWN